MNKILITGADGFIGSHLTEALVRAGYDVRAFVLYNSFNYWGWLDHCGEDVKDKFEVFAGDIRDPNGVRTAMKGCDAVLPKPLMPIGDSPILETIIKQLVAAGFTHITLAVNHQAEIIKAFFVNGESKSITRLRTSRLEQWARSGLSKTCRKIFW